MFTIGLHSLTQKRGHCSFLQTRHGAKQSIQSHNSPFWKLKVHLVILNMLLHKTSWYWIFCQFRWWYNSCCIFSLCIIDCKTIAFSSGLYTNFGDFAKIGNLGIVSIQTLFTQRFYWCKNNLNLGKKIGGSRWGCGSQNGCFKVYLKNTQYIHAVL